MAIAGDFDEIGARLAAERARIALKAFADEMHAKIMKFSIPETVYAKSTDHGKLTNTETGTEYLKRTIPKEWGPDPEYCIGNMLDGLRPVAENILHRAVNGWTPEVLLNQTWQAAFAHHTHGPAWDGTVFVRLLSDSHS